MSTKERGFGSPNMSQEERVRIARLGGIAAHKQGVAHEWNKLTAKIAGRKGARIRTENKIRREMEQKAARELNERSGDS